MFETVARRPRRDRRRALGAWLASLALNTSFVGVLVAAGTHAVGEIVEEPDQELTLVELAPFSPPPPPPPAASSRARRPVDATPETPVDPDPEPLPDDIPDDITDGEIESSDALADAFGVEGGEPGGVKDGVVGGTVGGVVGAPLIAGPAVKAVHWSQVKVKRRVPPRFPRAAIDLGLTEETCTVRFVIDEKGKPLDLGVDGCPTVFHEAVQKAAWQWRFYPQRGEHGRPMRATFLLKVVFRLK